MPRVAGQSRGFWPGRTLWALWRPFGGTRAVRTGASTATSSRDRVPARSDREQPELADVRTRCAPRVVASLGTVYVLEGWSKDPRARAVVQRALEDELVVLCLPELVPLLDGPDLAGARADLLMKVYRARWS